MWILIISLIALVCIALLAGYIRNQRLQKKIERGELDAMPEVKEADAECCGQHEICERDSLLAAVSKKIEYYDDEELDKYIGIAPEITLLNRKMNSGTYSIRCRTSTLPDGYAVCNCVE